MTEAVKQAVVQLGGRKVFAFVFVVLAYGLFSKWTGVPVEGNVFISMFFALAGANIGEHFAKRGA